jgi:hypothetical protein
MKNSVTTLAIASISFYPFALAYDYFGMVFCNALNQNVCLERRGLPRALEGVVLQFLHLIVRIALG